MQNQEQDKLRTKKIYCLFFDFLYHTVYIFFVFFVFCFSFFFSFLVMARNGVWFDREVEIRASATNENPNAYKWIGRGYDFGANLRLIRTNT